MEACLTPVVFWHYITCICLLHLRLYTLKSSRGQNRRRSISISWRMCCSYYGFWQVRAHRLRTTSRCRSSRWAPWSVCVLFWSDMWKHHCPTQTEPSLLLITPSSLCNSPGIRQHFHPLRGAFFDCISKNAKLLRRSSVTERTGALQEAGHGKPRRWQRRRNRGKKKEARQNSQFPAASLPDP